MLMAIYSMKRPIAESMRQVDASVEDHVDRA